MKTIWAVHLLFGQMCVVVLSSPSPFPKLHEQSLKTERATCVLSDSDRTRLPLSIAICPPPPHHQPGKNMTSLPHQSVVTSGIGMKTRMLHPSRPLATRMMTSSQGKIKIPPCCGRSETQPTRMRPGCCRQPG